MANEDSVILKEVDQALEEDRTWDFFRKHGTALIAGAVLIVGGVAGWQAWNHLKIQTAERQALEYRNALELLNENTDSGRAALDAVGAEKGGYGALASLRRASSYAGGGERLKALEIYRSVAAGDAPKRIREYASLRAGYLALADGRDAVMGDVSNLAEGEGPFSYYAKEILGVASLNAKDYESATAAFEALSLDLQTPAGVRDRAEEFSALAASGKAGVNISGELRVDDLVNSLGLDTLTDEPVDAIADTPAGDETDETIDGAVEDMAGDASAEDDHDGHNHEE